MKKILLFILLTACQEPPTAPKYHINIAGKWVSVDNSIELNIKQTGTDLTGTAIKDSIVYLIYGSIRSSEEVFIHLTIDDVTKLTFVGKIMIPRSPTTPYVFPNKINGVIKENNTVKEITFLSLRVFVESEI